MDKNCILELNNKDSVSDEMSELLRNGAQQLIHQAVESELNEYLSHHQRLTEDGRVALVCNGYLPKRKILTGIVPVSVRIPQGTKRRRRTHFPFCLGSALRPKNEISGGGITMAVPERRIYRRDGRSTKSPCWS